MQAVNAAPALRVTGGGGTNFFPLKFIKFFSFQISTYMYMVYYKIQYMKKKNCLISNFDDYLAMSLGYLSHHSAVNNLKPNSACICGQVVLPGIMTKYEESVCVTVNKSGY